MRTVAIIQARMGSKRLPGKALMRIGDHPILYWVLKRAFMVSAVDQVCVATTDLSEDDPIVALCEQLGVWCYRGSADDVLGRFHDAAVEQEADVVVRLTADCPLLDPDLAGEMLVHMGRHTYADYVTFTTRSVGFVQEAFTMRALEDAHQEAVTELDREHVVPWIIRNRKALFLKPTLEIGAGHWAVDTELDLRRLRTVYDLVPGLFDMSAFELAGHERAA